MDNQQTEPRQERKPYQTPVVVFEAPLEVRAGSPLGKILGGPIEHLTDPAGLW